MSIDWWTLGLQAINAIVLIWILARFLFRPVSKIIAERQAAAHSALDAAQAARAAAQADREAVKAEGAAMAAQRADLIAKAQAEAAQERQRLAKAAENEIAKTRAEAAEDIRKLRRQAQDALSTQAGELATDIARRLMERLPDAARIDGFIDGLADAVAELPEVTRTGLGVDGPLKLRAARAPNPEEEKALTAKLSAVLGRDVSVEITPDPTLIAGLELDAETAIVRNHLRADLDKIEAEVTAHDA